MKNADIIYVYHKLPTILSLGPSLGSYQLRYFESFSFSFHINCTHHGVVKLKTMIREGVVYIFICKLCHILLYRVHHTMSRIQTYNFSGDRY